MSAPMNCKERLQACLIMNDLSIPFDNKVIMILGARRDIVLTALLQVIRAGYPEAFLCWACLMNLSKLEDGRFFLLCFQPPEARMHHVLDNPLSMLRSIESMMMKYSQYSLSEGKSAEGLAMHSAVGMLCNITTMPDAALLVSKTAIPALVASLLHSSPKPVCRWTPGCLEDFSLSLLVQLTHAPESRRALQHESEKLCSYLASLSREQGIHGLRAATITCQVKLKD
jgi:hypothetical protein